MWIRRAGEGPLPQLLHEPMAGKFAAAKPKASVGVHKACRLSWRMRMQALLSLSSVLTVLLTLV